MKQLPPGASAAKKAAAKVSDDLRLLLARMLRRWSRTLSDGKWQTAPYFAFAAAYALVVFVRVFWPDNITKITLMFAVFALLSIGYMFMDGKITPVERLWCVGIGSVMIWVACAMRFGIDIMVFLAGLAVTTVIAIPYWKYLAEYKKPNHSYINANVIEPEKPKGEFDDVKWLQPDAEWADSRTPTNSGWRQMLDLPTGTAANDFINKRSSGMAAVLKVGHDDVELVQVPGRNDMVNVFVHNKGDYLKESSYWPPLQDGKLPRVWDPIPIGLRKTGEVVYISLVEKHMLIAGESGSGKSNELSKLAAIAAHDPAAQLWCLDGKRLELLPFRHAANGYVQDNIVHAVAMLKAIQSEMNFRYDEMGKMGIRKVHNSNGVFGPIVVMFDELARYIREGAQETQFQKEFKSLIFDLGERGRAAGISLITSVITPSAKLFDGGDMRSLFTYRMALRMGSTQGSTMVLGPGQPDASQLDQEQRGMFYMFDGQIVRIGRGSHVPDEHLAKLAEMAPVCENQWGVLMADEVAGEILTGNNVEGQGSIRSSGSITKYSAEKVGSIPQLPPADPDGPTFPDGRPITEEWHIKLWDALSDTDYRKASEFEPITGKTRNPVIVVLRRWTEAGYLEPTVRNNTTMWRRKARVDA